MKRVPMRFAHSAGHTDVCYSEDGKKIITCGSDGDVRIFEGFSDDDPMQSCVGSWSLAVCQKNDQIYIATDNNTVQILTYPAGERDGLLTRFTAHVNHISVGKKHNYIAMAGEDMEVKLMTLPNTAEANQNSKVFQGFSGPPLGVEVCPNGKLLAVSAGDGFLRIWNISTQELLKEFNCVPKANSFMNAKLFCRMSFEPISGINLAYPKKEYVTIVDSTDWNELGNSLNCHQVQCSYSIVQYSPCGRYLAAGSIEGDIVVWEANTQTLIGCTTHPNKVSICSMCWNPAGNGEIAYCDVQGKLGVVQNCCDVLEKNEDAASAIIQGVPENMNFADFQFEGGSDNNDEDDDGISLEKLKKEIQGPFEDGDLEDRDNATSRCSSPRLRSRTPEIPLQEPFQPSSTPEHLNPRYMCWNDVGIVRCYGSTLTEDDGDSSQSIEVEFLDSTFHNSMMLHNYQGYTMASLSTAALVVANSRQAKVVPLASGTNEWCINLPDEEDIACITSSSNLICLGTSTYQLRIFTIYGTQCLIVSAAGPLITIASQGYNVVAAYHTSGVRKGDQCIGLMNLYCKGKDIKNKYVECPLSSAATLLWLGYSDVGSLVSYDSTGILRLFPLRSNVWFPCLDISNHKTSVSDGFFVTAVMESRQAVRGIRCKGTIYPGFTPQPTQSELTLQLPFVELDTDKAQLEANICLWSTMKVSDSERKCKEAALKLFALACKNNLDLRAYELVEILSSVPQLLLLATKYSSRLNNTRLAKKLQELSAALENNCDGSDEEDTEERFPHREHIREKITTTTPVIKPLAPKLNRSYSKDKFMKNRSSLSDSGAKSQTGEELSSKKSNLLDNCTPTTSEVNTQESLFGSEDSTNTIPFLKSFKKNKAGNYNPLSLTDKFAGYTAETAKENKADNSSENGEKRKHSDSSDGEKQKDKQRKLDAFMFKKRN